MLAPLLRTFRAALSCLSGSVLCGALLLCGRAEAQSESAARPSDNPPELNAKIELLTKSLQQTQVELAQSRAEIQQLRAALEEVLKRIQAQATGAGEPAVPIAAPPAGSGAQTAAQISQDDWDLLNAKVEDQHQTKVESGSKFRLRLSGLALFNAFATDSPVDNFDLPNLAVPGLAGYPRGGAGASVRQSTIGLTGFGPILFGAQTSADLHMDFFGGVPPGYASSSSGIAHVKLARIRFDWKNTSAVAGLDYAFFSPNLPTSYMSIAVPAFASAGNLWAWTPMVRVEHRFTGGLSPFKVEAGFLDPASDVNFSSTNIRVPDANESSRQPTYAARLSANRKSEDNPVSVGVSGVYSPQRYFGGNKLSGWAGIVDWKFPLLARTELSGQFFSGRGIDGFGGVPLSPYPPQSEAFYEAITARLLANTRVIGGWSQLKLKLSARNEFNAAAGMGGRNSMALRQIVLSSPPAFIPARNQMMFVNYIFKPRSDLLFSGEYRRFRTYQVFGGANTAGQLGLAVGFLF